jgi:hypothetical protein
MSATTSSPAKTTRSRKNRRARSFLATRLLDIFATYGIVYSEYRRLEVVFSVIRIHSLFEVLQVDYVRSSA